jgi:urease accessory protein
VGRADPPPRAFVGLADLTFAPRDGRTRLVRSLTRPPLTVGRALHPDEALPDLAHLILANPTAGIFAGDRLSIRVRLEPGARAHLTTGAATRVHAMPSAGASQAVRLIVAAGAALEWLPEPTIPFGGARFTQVTTLRVAPGGTLIYGDILTPGRVAAGEALAYTRLAGRLTLARADGQPLYREAFSILPGRRSPLGRGLLGVPPATLGTLLVVTDAAPAERLRDAIRGALAHAPHAAVRAGVSVLPGGGGVCAKALAAETAPVSAALRVVWGVARRHIWDVGLPPPRKY